MYFWKAKDGSKLTIKEFFSKWGEGIKEVASSPKQQINSKLGGTKIMLLGFICGLAVTLYNWQSTWWLAVILLGGLIINWVQYVATKQQLMLFKSIEEQMDKIPEPQIPEPKAIAEVKGGLEKNE